ncbi:beta-phosphoglucomutase [Jiulongibacter sediminis]|jgi:beta-phosphoglucomutase|uniref:beta-phosphoglucomutase n=1 Tax=Jiulongibacter sediminis TaxID=1605367 RepID=UPI0026EAB40C|nr:beta-phosphoglucomutase [Jiulongibacter sediminis]
MIKGFLFDLDGVIVDTAVYHYAAWKKMANQMGFDIDEEFNETLKGISRMDSIARILEHGKMQLPEDRILELATLKNDWYVEMIDEMTEENILPGITELIAQIKESGLKMALGSASKNAPRILDRIGLASFFDAVVDGNSVSKSKPDPEVFIKGAEALELKNDECVVVEDAFAGIEAAHAAGMKAIGIGTAENLPNADLILTSFEGVDLQDLIDQKLS